MVVVEENLVEVVDAEEHLIREARGEHGVEHSGRIVDVSGALLEEVGIECANWSYLVSLTAKHAQGQTVFGRDDEVHLANGVVTVPIDGCGAGVVVGRVAGAVDGGAVGSLGRIKLLQRSNRDAGWGQIAI